MNIDRIPPRQEVLSELYPRDGETCSINDYLGKIESGEFSGFHYEAQALKESQIEGFTYMFRLPQNNSSNVQNKYGDFYQVKSEYHDFIIALAKRNGIHDLKRVFDLMYVLKDRESAQILSQKLTEAREKCELEFEIVEGETIQDIPVLAKE
jgi:hypothetical protein